MMDRRMKEEEEEEDIFYSPQNMEASDDEENGRNDEDENTLLSHLRVTLENQDPSCKEIDDLTLRRFLRARDLDVEKASRMFIRYLTWRRSFVPKGSISQSEIINQLNDNKIYMQGMDTRGCPVLVVFGAKHFPSKGGTEELKRLVVFAFDKLCSRIPDGQEKLTIIVDLQGYGYSNSDVRGYTAILSILQEYYPERLGKVFMIHVPYIFMTVWKIIYPFIDKNTKKKFVFIESKKLRGALLEEINESQLPDIYGGKLKLVPIQDSNT